LTNLAIIPARGGSKRIPKKNIKFFLGKPIIAYAIQNATDSEIFDEIMVSTDDEEIAEVALSYGVKAPFKRSEENSNDFASTMDVINEVILNYKTLGIKFEYASCMYPCTPLLTKGSLIESFYILKKSTHQSS
jgi:pseudaminic acid cytidylyltransferase